MTSTIPAEIGNLTNLSFLALAINQLTGSIPTEIGYLTNLNYLILSSNRLSGIIPTEINNLTNLTWLFLSDNQLTGIIPAEISNLTNLIWLFLNSNKLTGEIPTTLKNLTALTYLSLNYNSLHTANADLLLFLNKLNTQWKATQTMVPEDVFVRAVGENSVSIQWTPISYISDPGGYEVYYSTVSGGPYTLFGTTVDKSADRMMVTGLEIDTTYYFVVQTKTLPNLHNQNTVVSNYSHEISATTGFDVDGDGIPGDWEIQYFGDTSRDGTGDYDMDGLTDLQEYQNGTNPTMSDTDGDGMPDEWEVQYGLNPNDNSDANDDPDGDGLTNIEEHQNGTDPTVTNNNPPVANAGEDQPIHIGDVATLNGSGSYDRDEDYPLTYAWEIVEKPAGSVAELDDAESINPSFTADKSGVYRIELTVTDNKGLQSTPDEVVVSTFNTAPIADAGPDQAVITIGTLVQLDGCSSWDDDGDPILYDWDLIKPEGSSASLNDPTICNPTFVADVHGEYEIELVVDDPWDSSDPDVIKTSFNNIVPVADAGNNQSVTQGDTIYLDGSGSNDANLDLLTYSWSIVTKPDNSTTTINSPGSANTYFTADVPGEYVISLIVNDGYGDSIPDNIAIVSISYMDAATEDLQDAITIINSLDVSLFKNKNNKKTLTNKINTVLSKMEEGNYHDAIKKLENDILDKMDGCEENGNPENNDWIIDCTAQDQVYPIIMDAINNITSTMITHEDAATEDLEEAITIINVLDSNDFKGKNSKMRLINKINTALLKIGEGHYQAAINKLENDILGKMNGCEASGNPDNNDWIIDCTAQNQVYPVIMDAISELHYII